MKKYERNMGETTAFEVQKLADLAIYQSASIVSRTLLERPVGTVSLFAFDAGQGLSEHSAPFDALVYILDGTACITIGGKPLSLKNGEMVVMPANIPHALRAEQRFKMLLIMLKD